MREIKFRAWDGERFLYFDLFDLAIRQPTEYLFREASTFPQYESIPRHIDGLVIEQYTGLKDNKGVEIYEGDIVNGAGLRGAGADFVTMERFPVYWLEHEQFGWEGEELVDCEYVKVIGNIHENPNWWRKQNERD